MNMGLSASPDQAQEKSIKQVLAENPTSCYGHVVAQPCIAVLLF